MTLINIKLLKMIKKLILNIFNFGKIIYKLIKI